MSDQHVTNPEILSQLSGLQTMMADLMRGLPATEANRRFHSRLAPLAWYLGRSVYRELHWLREVLAGDTDLAERVRPIFATQEAAAPAELLPPRDHLLAWAEELQGEHLRRLANPGALPDSPWLQEDRLSWFLLQETARDYEAMLWVLLARRLSGSEEAPGGEPLLARPPSALAVEITQGHYRIGSRDESFAYDNELPPQAAELSSFRIAQLPVANAEFLGFMVAGGYARPDLWDAEGQAWLTTSQANSPWHWRQDGQGRWFGLGLNGARPLSAEEPVAGLSRHEARAYAAWVASLGGALAGAVLQHEYQWEIAARAGHLQGTGRVWEWCANPFHPYPDFSPSPEPSASQFAFAAHQGILRGASLYTQRCLRRASFRHAADPADRYRVSGLRLVFPPI
ncbi:MAG: SUMF1/EgtB/PvdO family nonheme iron enzyme, partial [Chromatiaceae bacterium]|nr:SUMF1/EgtB/PvdO family nonheme iron enzyme [Chromatiaceae bacterium]